MRVAVLTVSDGVSNGERVDKGGPALEEVLTSSAIEHEVVLREVLPDDRQKVARAIRFAAYARNADLVLLTGGTGVAPRDRTPEAVRDVIEFEVPGLAEKMRASTGESFPAAYLSRQVVGVRGKTLVVALPGSPAGAADCLRSIVELLGHAVDLVRGESPGHPAAGSAD